jgi:hypothetical protein
MYELFSGCRAFAGATTADVLQRVLAAQPTPIEALVPSLDPELARIISRAMARRPDDRYADLQALRKDLARARRRALQASADDATVVVAVPSMPAALTPPPTVVPTPRPPSEPSATAAQEDRALAHLARERTQPAAAAPARPAVPPASSPVVPPVPAPVLPQVPPPVSPSGATSDTLSDETIFAPLVSSGIGGATEPITTAAPPVASAPPPPPPLPVSPAVPVVDDGPLPVPLPAVSSSARPPVSGGRVTVDAETIAQARAVEPQPTAPALAMPAGPPAIPSSSAPAPVRGGLAAPPPLAAPGVVGSPSGSQTAPLPATRKGIPPAILITAVMVLLACCFAAAFVAFRMMGSGSLSGLFTRTVEPKISGPAEPGPVALGSTGVDATQPLPDQPADTAPATEVALDAAQPTEPSSVAPATETPIPAPAVATPAPAQTPAPVTPTASPVPAPPARTTVAPRPVPAPRPPAPSRQAAVTPSVSTPREVAAVAPAVAEPPRVVERAPERREPEPPAAPVAPQAEGLSLVRAYVAARNTAHAAGIRRVWPTVDEVHLRRITSAFSAPLTLGDCDVEARDAQHAVATCRLTQAGTTGAYANGSQALSIRRTFVFDLQRDGRGWVIAGLRE